MRKPQGYATIHGPLDIEGLPPGPVALKDGECDTFQCKHCQRITLIPSFTNPADMGGWCRKCEGLICERCAGLDTCRPWQEKMNAIERNWETDRMVSRIVGRE